RCARWPCASALVTLTSRRAAVARSVAVFAPRLLRIVRVRVTMPCDPCMGVRAESAAQRPRNKCHLRRSRGKCLRAEAKFDEGFDEHALGAADRSNRRQPAFTNPIVDGETR